ncbi:MAG: alpha/beta fold hydrolase [Candidatus Liptonbacteria bacterium]|nr:alpha/beta fold hydrolase [Candidatus Liptonbacteria bacterium]
MGRETIGFQPGQIKSLENAGLPVEIAVGDRKIAGRLFVSAERVGKIPGVLFLPGWRGNQAGSFENAQAISKEGYECLTFDFGGWGASSGDASIMSRKDFLDDAVAAYDFLAHANGVDPENINVVGSSFGCYVAALLSKERSVKSLTLRAPADYPDEGFDEAKIQTADQPGAMEWRSRIRDFSDTAALRSIHEFKGDIFVIESGSDDMVPRGTVQSYMNAIPDAKKLSHVVMDGAPHALSKSPQAREEYAKILAARFSENKKAE